MNELKIFENAECKITLSEVNGKKEILINGNILDRFGLLALAHDDENEENAWRLMGFTSKLFHPLDDWVFNDIYGCVAFDIARKFDKNEFYYQQLFSDEFPKIRKGKLVDVKSDGKNIPDRWVDVGGELIPVEVKYGTFDAKALKQLLRYIKAYSCNRGIAVAQNVTVELPRNIEFISIDELKAAKPEC